MRRRVCEPSERAVFWQEGNLYRAARWAQIGQHGATPWFTGLSGSGKSAIAAATEERLIASGRWAYRLDGDNLRHGVCRDLAFNREDRAENAQRVAELAVLFADAGCVALVCLISPFAADRRCARECHERAGLTFVEVFVNTSLPECARRDIRGLYARARSGALTDLTGIGSPYEPPTAPDVELTGDLDIATAAERVMFAFATRERGQQHEPVTRAMRVRAA
jgi:adenylyl-sulfate kinase